MVGGIYEFSESANLKSPSTYAHALRCCIAQHPLLATIIEKAETNAPYFAFCPRLDLSHHIEIVDSENSPDGEIKSIERVLPSILDKPWPSLIPPWNIVVLPFSKKRCFVAFSFSHGLGDGMCGIAFHRTFLDALQEQPVEKGFICIPERKQMNPAFDTPIKLPISWSFLLSPLLGAYLPRFLASLLGFSATRSIVTSGTWTGALIFASEEYRTGVEVISIGGPAVEAALKACRTNGAKLTGFIHQLVITSLSDSLSHSQKFDSVVAGTAINLRGSVGITNDEMGLFVSGLYDAHALETVNLDKASEFSWTKARAITDKLAEGSKTLNDQPIGLLRYLSDMRSWTLSKIGQARDCSYEISNLLAFKPSSFIENCAVTEMVFCQPAAITGQPLTFNVVSTTGGPMNIAVSWQLGALNLGSHDDEVDFVRKVCENVARGFIL